MVVHLPGKLVLVGAGNMGGALLAGWLERGLDPKMIAVQDPGPPPAMQALLDRHGIAVSSRVELAEPVAVLLVAVKPQVMEQVFPPLARLVGRGTVVLSVAAGKRFSVLRGTYRRALLSCVRSRIHQRKSGAELRRVMATPM